METWYSHLFKNNSICYAALQASFVWSPAFCFFLFKNKQKTPSEINNETGARQTKLLLLFLYRNFNQHNPDYDQSWTIV